MNTTDIASSATATTQPINHRKIAKQFQAFAQEVVELVPHLSELISVDDNGIYIIFNVVQEMLENLLLQNPLNPRDFVETHILSGKRAISICVGRQYEQIMKLLNFFRSVSSDGALIETATSSKPIDLNTCNIENIVPSQYFVYLPIKTESGGSSYVVFNIRYDIPYGKYFTIHELRYPFGSHENREHNIAIIDIALKNIVPYVEARMSELLYEASQLFARGYRFNNDGLAQRLFAAAIQQISESKFYIRDDAFIIRPSGVEGHIPGIIVKTQHKHVFLSDVKELYNHTDIMNMVHNSPLSLDYWKLPESGSGYGVTSGNVTVYKGARCNMFSGKQITQQDIIDKKHHSSYIVLVELEVPAFTRFYRGMDSELVKFRFEKAIVKKFYSYPKRPIDIDISVFSDYDNNFSYRIGDTVTPDNGPFFSSRKEICQSGIHAFMDTSSVWCYFRNNRFLLNYAETVVTLNVLTTDED